MRSSLNAPSRFGGGNNWPINQTFRKAIVSSTRTPHQAGDQRLSIGMDPDGDQVGGVDALEFLIKEFNSESFWETLFKVAGRTGGGVVDAFVSGFLRAGDGVLSEPGLIWEEHGALPSGLVKADAIASDGTTAIFHGEDGTGEASWVSSDNGDSWAGRTSAPSIAGKANDMAAKSGTFIVVGNTDTADRSDDSGSSWSSLTMPFSSHIYGIAAGDTYWIAVGAAGEIAWSDDDGATWTLVSTSGFGSSIIWKVGYGNGRFVAVASDGKVGYADEAGEGVKSTWTLSASPGFGSERILGGVHYDDGVWVAGSEGGHVRYSIDDAVTWAASTATGLGSDAVRGPVTAEGVWLISDSSYNIWRSVDKARTFEIVASISGSQVFQDVAALADGRVMAATTNDPFLVFSDWTRAGAGIVEQGSSSDGEDHYIKFSSGAMVQWGITGSISVSAIDANIGLYGWSAFGGQTTVTFLETFTNVPVVACNAYDDGSNEMLFARSEKPSTTSFIGRVVTQQADAVEEMTYIAIGFWR